MRRIVLAAWIVVLTSFHAVFAQSIVFVSPSTKGLLTMSCAEGSLSSFEQLHYMAGEPLNCACALCSTPRIDKAADWVCGRGQRGEIQV